jgi:hypothetical protein
MRRDELLVLLAMKTPLVEFGQNNPAVFFIHFKGIGWSEVGKA